MRTAVRTTNCRQRHPLRSNAALGSSAQTLTANSRYDAFGNTISQSGGLADDKTYRYSSKEIHPASGLYDYGYRWYAPALQRWLNRDPIGENGGVNLYGFLSNDGINSYDLLGLIGLPTDVDSVSQSIWQAIRQGRWDEAIELIEQESELLGNMAEKLQRAVKQMRGLDKWRKQMCNWSGKQRAEQLKTLRKTLKDHLDKPYRGGIDDPETLRLRYMIDYLEGLLK